MSKIILGMLLLSVALLIFISGCTQKLIIKTGTSFGECNGYCKEELTITQDNIVYIKSGWDNSLQEIREEVEISDETWNSLSNALDKDKFESLQEIIGCPDCADGGAEWIEIDDGFLNKRVTFEYGASIPDIDNLVKELRDIRESVSSKFKEQ